MTVESIETFVVNIPYNRREVSSIVARDGVTAVLVKITTNDGVVGWGEACSGADVASIVAAIQSMVPFVVGRDPWNAEALHREVLRYGLWRHRVMTCNYAWAAIDMALWDIRGKVAGQPLYRLLGGALRDSVNYFYYLVYSTPSDVAKQCLKGVKAGYEVFYLKAGIDFDVELEMVSAVRQAIGPKRKIRLDVNAAWNVSEALARLRKLAQFDIDFVEQPIQEQPPEAMAELRRRSPIPLAANEGLWTEEDVRLRLFERVADVYTFGPYWVGTLLGFQRLSFLADSLGFLVCKHTHGELGVAAAAAHQVLLTLPNLVDGNQQTASHNAGDVLTIPLPISSSPTWGIPDTPGLSIEVDQSKVEESVARFEQEGQYMARNPSPRSSDD